MALQLSYDDRFGTTHASAYHRVLSLELFVDSQAARVRVGTYKDAQARTDGKEVLITLDYTFTATTPATYDDLFGVTALDVVDMNPIKSVYNHLKTLPEWAGASDV